MMEPYNLEEKVERWTVELRKGTLELYVLTVIHRSPTYGAKVCRRLYELTEGSLDLKAGTLYPILRRLEEGGWIDGKLVECREGEKGPGRKIYQLTSTGKQLLNSMIAKMAEAIKALFKAYDRDVDELEKIFSLLSEF